MNHGALPAIACCLILSLVGCGNSGDVYLPVRVIDTYAIGYTHYWVAEDENGFAYTRRGYASGGSKVLLKITDEEAEALRSYSNQTRGCYSCRLQSRAEEALVIGESNEQPRQQQHSTVHEP